MNVTTSQSAIIASNTDVSSTQSQKTANNSKTSEKSFDEEIKSASKAEETKDTKNNQETEKSGKSEKKSNENNKTNQKVNNSHENIKTTDDIVSQEILNGEINFTDFKYHNESQSILSQNIQNLLNTKDLMSTVSLTVDYDSINMSYDDANFFVNLVQRNDISMNNIMNQVGNEIVKNSKNIEQNIKVSSVLMEKLAESLRTNKPFRIDFDKDISIIIKVNKDGSLAANFIPGDKAVEQYLKNNIDSLRQRFDEENLPYSELSYNNSKERQQRRKKENDNE